MSRRMKGRHAKVKADPKALPAKPVALDDSNSFRDPAQPDCRKPLRLNGRTVVEAESVIALKREAARKKAEAEAAERLAEEA
jgi:hypothetical protein